VESPFRLAPNGFGRRGLFRLHWCSAGVIMRPALYKVPSHGVPPVVKRGYRGLFRLHWRVASARIKLWVRIGVPVIRKAPEPVLPPGASFVFAYLSRSRDNEPGVLRCLVLFSLGRVLAKSPGTTSLRRARPYCVPPTSDLPLSAFLLWEE
jgi:hypothetical protein